MAKALTEAKIWSADLVHLKGFGFLLCRSMKVRIRARTHKIRFCKRGSLNVRFAPETTELLPRSEMSRWATCGHAIAHSGATLSPAGEYPDIRIYRGFALGSALTQTCLVHRLRSCQKNTSVAFIRWPLRCGPHNPEIPIRQEPHSPNSQAWYKAASAPNLDLPILAPRTLSYVEITAICSIAMVTAGLRAFEHPDILHMIRARLIHLSDQDLTVSVQVARLSLRFRHGTQHIGSRARPR